jgi:SAM-dependent methyltransferase
MDWVEAFYTRQNEWSGCYMCPVEERDRERVAAMQRLVGSGKKRILELGAGGGQTAAAAAAGHSVTAVELAASLAEHARELARLPRAGTLTVIQGDFYHVEIETRFDVVCCWDGFGIGADEGQRRLLQRIASWLAPGGCALIDVNTPWYWANAAGVEMRFEKAARRYDFDAGACRLLDRWWPPDDEQQAVTQSLCWYSPADLRLLLEGTGLALAAVEPGGAVDYERWQYAPRVPLTQAMTYLAKLTPATTDGVKRQGGRAHRSAAP